MRTIQQTFDAVIAAGGYQDQYVPCTTSSFMCNALGYQVYQGTITAKEAERAERAISEYMAKYLRTGKDQTLSQGLIAATGELSTFEQRLAIYKNWAKRPRKFKNIERVL